MVRRGMRLVVLVLVVALVPEPAAAAGDPGFDRQWGLQLIGAPAAWTQTTGAGVRIGIVDTGVDLEHEDLAGQVVAHTTCVDTAGEAAACSGSGADAHGHGTHVAGIAAAIRGNGKGIAGLAPDAELVVAKVTDDGGIAVDDVKAAVRWLVDRGARVINLSLGDPIALRTSLFGTTLAEELERAWSQGAVPVLAAGNTGLLGLGLGSSDYGDLNAVVVGATGRDGRVAEYSSATGNAKWALMAPGGGFLGGDDGVYSTFWREGERNQYANLSGTSMAAPHVSGALALVLAQGLSPADAVVRLLDTADRRVSCGQNSPTCRGLLDVAAATGAGR